METLSQLPVIYKLCMFSGILLVLLKMGLGSILAFTGARLFAGVGLMAAQILVLAIYGAFIVTALGSAGYFIYTIW